VIVDRAKGYREPESQVLLLVAHQRSFDFGKSLGLPESSELSPSEESFGFRAVVLTWKVGAREWEYQPFVESTGQVLWIEL
jgi:hypothetical protein